MCVVLSRSGFYPCSWRHWFRSNLTLLSHLLHSAHQARRLIRPASGNIQKTISLVRPSSREVAGTAGGPVVSLRLAQTYLTPKSYCNLCPGLNHTLCAFSPRYLSSTFTSIITHYSRLDCAYPLISSPSYSLLSVGMLEPVYRHFCQSPSLPHQRERSCTSTTCFSLRKPG